jgi:hypothetical protein
MGAVQSLGAGTTGDYPAAQRSGVEEATAQYKFFGATVNVPQNLLELSGSDLLQYSDPLTDEMDAKNIAMARVMSLEMAGDGSGIIGVLNGAPTNSGSQGLFTVSATSANAGRSHIGWFNEGDKIKFRDTDDTAADFGVVTGTVDYYIIDDINDSTRVVTVSAYDSSDAALTINGAGTLATTDYVYRYGITTFDATDVDSTDDYNALSEAMVGLEGLIRDDGQTVNGVTLDGAKKGTIDDLSSAQINSSHFQSVLSRGKRRTGLAFMYDKTLDALIEANETDRRFMSYDDGTRGFKRIGYQHSKDFVGFEPDEFIPEQRIWMPPSSKEVLEFHGKDFRVVEVNPGQKFHLKTSSTGSGHAREVQAYLEGAAVVICKHTAAVLNLRDFTV